MKKNIVIITIAALAAFVAVGAGAWYYFYGPALDARIARVDTAVDAEKKAQDAAEKAIDGAAQIPEGWQDLKIDSTAEIARILDDMDANRQYKVDNYRDPAAASIAADIAKADAELAKVEKELKALYKDLTKAENSFLPSEKSAAASEAIEANERVARRVKQMRAGLKELKNDNFIWGHLAAAVAAGDSAMRNLGLSEAALAAGDYAALKASNSVVLSDFQVCAEWVSLGKQELINIGIYSKDSTALMELVGQGRVTAEAFDNCALFMFGARADAAAFEQAQGRANQSLQELRKQASRQGLNQDYKTWFLAAAKRHLSG